jgi:zinc protease
VKRALCVAGVLLAGCARAPTVERFTLANGLRVQLAAGGGAPNTAVVLAFDAGGDDDPAGRSGMAHLLEHVLFTAAAGGAKARTAQEAMRAYPAGWNAQTGDSYTVLATVVPDAGLEAELGATAARMGGLSVTDDDLLREKPRLVEEVENMFGGFPALAASNLAREAIRPSPHGGRKGGLPAHVAAITTRDLDELRHARYTPSSAHLVVAGGFDSKRARGWIEREFGPLPPGSPAPRKPAPGVPSPGLRVVAIAPRLPMSKPVVSLAYRAPGPGDAAYPAFLVLGARLATRLAPSAPSQVPPPVAHAVLDDPEVLFVNGAVEPGETPEAAVARLDARVVAVVSGTLTPADIAAVRSAYGTMLGAEPAPALMLRHNPYGVAFSLARREQLGIDGAALAAAWKAMTDDALQAAAAAFAPGRRAAVVVTAGP